jgi:molybdopterin biosynthesis enzyme
MRPFREVISLAAAREILDTTGSPIPRLEMVPLDQANGRVLARDVIAQEDVPPFSRAGMDGFAVRARDTHGASRQAPRALRKVGTIYTGQISAIPVRDGECIEISTHSPWSTGIAEIWPV